MNHSQADLLIIGASGMLGQALVRESQNRGITAVGAGLFGTDCILDICDDTAFAQLVERIAPKAIINCAAITDLNACEREPGRAYAVNARFVSVLAEICCKGGLKLVQISTDHFFTGDGSCTHSEGAPVRLVNEYARTKYAAEQFALTCPNALVLRTNIVGFRGWQGQPTFVEWALHALQAGENVTLFADFFTSSIDVQHFASALFDLLAKEAAGLFNLASSEVASKKQFIETLARAAACSLAHAESGSVKSIEGAPRAESAGLDVTKAEHLLGYHLPTLDEVIATLLSEYSEMTHAVRQGH